MEKVIELYKGVSIYKVHLDELRERDVNARVMEKPVFERLSANIKKDKRLESLPLCVKNPNQEGELTIISGHHRTRAARTANVVDIYVMVIEDELTEDQITSKQLAHNALNGRDDSLLLSQLYESIKDLDAKLEAGIMEIENERLSASPIQEINLEFNFEVVTLMFLPTQKTDFDKALSLMQPSAEVLVENLENFEAFKKACRAVSLGDNIRSIASIVHRMSEIVIEHYKNLKEQKVENNVLQSDN